MAMAEINETTINIKESGRKAEERRVKRSIMEL